MSRVKKLMLAAIGLLAVAVVVNLTDPTHSLSRLAAKQTTMQAQVARHFGGKPKPLKSLGNETAKVKLTVYVQSTNHCHEPTITACEKIAKAAPKRVRVEFTDTVTPEGAKAAQKAVSCETGILVNGRDKFKIEVRGQETEVGFHGPVGMGTPPDVLRQVLEAELTKQYGKRLTSEENTRLAAAWKGIGKMGPGGPMMPGGMPGAKGGMPGGPGGTGKGGPGPGSPDAKTTPPASGGDEPKPS